MGQLELTLEQEARIIRIAELWQIRTEAWSKYMKGLEKAGMKCFPPDPANWPTNLAEIEFELIKLIG